MITLGEVELTIVNDETVDKANQISDYPTEDSEVVSDNSETRPTVISISGMVKGNEAYNKLKKLRQYSDDGQPIRYSGRNVYDNMVIANLSTSHSGLVKGGFLFNIELKQILLSELQETTIDFDVIAPQAVASTKNLGVKSIIEVDEEKEEPYVAPMLTGHRPPNFKSLEEAIADKINLRNTQGREAMKAQLSAFKSDERRKRKVNSYGRATKGISTSTGRR